MKKANNTDFVKNLLNLRKDVAMVKILMILPLIRNVEAKTKLLMILPVFFSHAEVFGQNMIQAIQIIRLLQSLPTFVKEKCLFNGWIVRLLDANRRFTQRHLESDYFSKTVGTTATAHKFITIPGTDLIDPIGYAELDFLNSYLRFLKFHKLHKYLYFFSNLSAIEIQNVDESNIQMFENKVNIFPMTTGARRAILRRLADLKNRPARLTVIKEITCLSEPEKIEELLEEVKTILRTPIRGCIIYSSNDDLPTLLADAIEKMCREIRNCLNLSDERILPVANQLVFLLKRAWSCQFFSNDQKSLFNQLRWDITLQKKNSLFQKKPTTIQKPKQENPTESPRLGKDLLDELISYMEEWLTRKRTES